jgi:hypothetical protein
VRVARQVKALENNRALSTLSEPVAGVPLPRPIQSTEQTRLKLALDKLYTSQPTRGEQRAEVPDADTSALDGHEEKQQHR